MKLSFFVVLVVCFAAKEVYSQACHMREMDLCMAMGMFHYQSQGIPAYEEQVEEWCETMKEVSDCMGNFSSKCLSPVQREVLSLFAAPEDEGSKFCTPGSEARARYLSHSECLSSLAETDEFKGHLRDLQNTVEEVFDSAFANRFPLICCGFKRFYSGTDRSTEEKCGAGAVDMTRSIMKMMTSDLPSVLCQRFDPLSDECQSLLPPPDAPSKDPSSKSQIGKLLDTLFGNA